MLRIKRAYEPYSRSDGYRVLVDRLWPRGLRKTDAHFDTWLKELAPSEELRKWFAHDPKRFDRFRRCYEHELAADDAAAGLLDGLAKRASHSTVTLVYGARDEEHNNAVVLAEALERRLAKPRSSVRRASAPLRGTRAPRVRSAAPKPRTRKTPARRRLHDGEQRA